MLGRFIRSLVAVWVWLSENRIDYLKQIISDAENFERTAWNIKRHTIVFKTRYILN